MHEIIRETTSLCPVCLEKIPAEIVAEDDNIYMIKKCSDHGTFKVIIWRDSKENYLKWIEYAGEQVVYSTKKTHTEVRKGCPFDCGICPEHQQDTCSAAIMTTNRCNIDCPVCFTRTKGEPLYEPHIDSIKKMFEFYLETFGEPYPIELCGGEPTVRDDLPKIVSIGKEMGFDYIQINTNGIRITQDKDYLLQLKEAGATTVYLGFDGVTDKSYEYTSGKNLFGIKQQAVKNCSEVEIGVVLVPCVIPGVNDNQLGDIINFAKKWIPTVKGVYFQPISYFGNYPGIPHDKDRITIPDVLRGLEEQTNGEIRKTNFLPPGCEHPLCSFNGYFILKKDGSLIPTTKFQQRKSIKDAAGHVRKFTKRNWIFNENKYLTIGGMAFQDVWSVDVERLKRCIIQIINPEGRLVPLCAKYLTSIDGKKIYPGIA